MAQIRTVPFDNLHLVIGMVDDKDVSGILALFPKEATYYFCKADIPRGMDAQKLKSAAGSYGMHGQVYASVKSAYKAAVAGAGSRDLVFVGGSTFVVAEVLV
jgi:dihydrofolate synthase/folylpolyglutamate synthase